MSRPVKRISTSSPSQGLSSAPKITKNGGRSFEIHSTTGAQLLSRKQKPLAMCSIEVAHVPFALEFGQVRTFNIHFDQLVRKRRTVSKEFQRLLPGKRIEIEQNEVTRPSESVYSR
jgi:hypothetical protein